MPRVWVLALIVATAIGGGTFILLKGGDVEPTVSRVFRFELLSWRCDHANVVTADEVIEAEGDFCYAALNIVNEGAMPATLDPSCQFLLDDQGGRFTPRLDVMALDRASSDAFGGEIAAGGLVENAALYFDVPKQTNPRALELHEVCAGQGLEVPLMAENMAT